LPRKSHFLRVPAEFQKCGRLWAPSDRAFLVLTSVTISSREPCRVLWNSGIFSSPCFAPAQKWRTHPTPLRGAAATGSGVPPFGVLSAFVCVVGTLLLIVRRNFTRSINRHDPVAVLTTKNPKDHIVAGL